MAPGFLLLPPGKQLLQQDDSLVHDGCRRRQDDDAGHDQVEAEDLAAVDGQVP